MRLQGYKELFIVSCLQMGLRCCGQKEEPEKSIVAIMYEGIGLADDIFATGGKSTR